jgi:hypothetical protein
MRNILPDDRKPVPCCAEEVDGRWDRVDDRSVPRHRSELSQDAAQLEGQIKGALNDVVGDDPPLDQSTHSRARDLGLEVADLIGGVLLLARPSILIGI